MLLDMDMLVPFTSPPWFPTLMELSPLLMSLLLLLPVLTIWPPSTELLKLLMDLDMAMVLAMVPMLLAMLRMLALLLTPMVLLSPWMSLLLLLPVLSTWLPRLENTKREPTSQLICYLFFFCVNLAQNFEP